MQVLGSCVIFNHSLTCCAPSGLRLQSFQHVSLISAQHPPRNSSGARKKPWLDVRPGNIWEPGNMWTIPVRFVTTYSQYAHVRPLISVDKIRLKRPSRWLVTQAHRFVTSNPSTHGPLRNYRNLDNKMKG